MASGTLTSARRLWTWPSRKPSGMALEELVAPFHGDGHLSVIDYHKLFLYFVEGWTRHVSGEGAAAAYPGWPSRNGTVADRMEGFARVVPLFGAWIRGGRSPVITLLDGRRVDLTDAFHRGLLAGTDPESAGYWGELRDHDQRLVEAADVALSLWLLRDWGWTGMASAQKGKVIAWLAQVDEREGHDNNWHLFPILVRLVLHQLGAGADLQSARRRYARVKEFYRGDGWFSDGEHGSFDYYNAWGFHYALHWLHEIDPDWDPVFIRSALSAFLGNYRYLMGPEGFPMIGRSACYRMAAPAPLIFGHVRCPEQVTPGQARRALDATWRYFARRGALDGGNVTQGYLGADPRMVENYSGPASCLWSLRSLVAAFELPDASPFWRSTGEPLPVEQGDYRIYVPSTGWTITGRHDERSITVQMPHPPHPGATLEAYGLRRRFLALLTGKPQRPDNYAAKSGRGTYSSARPLSTGEARARWWQRG